MLQKLNDVVIIGAGPAGLTAGYLLTKKGLSVTILEADEVYVGGIARTAKYKGFHFDIGGHRFFSKSKDVEDLWSEFLPDDMLQRPRMSRIYYRGKFFSYPLKAFDALIKLGIWESILCVLSYARTRLVPIRDPRSFEDWVTNQFGRRLFSIFFKTYTEKVWGMSCKEISADWAAQRIKNLSLASAILHSLGLKKNKSEDRSKMIKTLIESFRYPRKGPGMMWEACAARIKLQGGSILMGRQCTGLLLDPATGRWHAQHADRAHNVQEVAATHVISSAPMRELVLGLQPRASSAAHEAASRLRYRDFLTVVLISRGGSLFPDNWIYIHEPSVKVGRVQNFKSWSPEMVPDDKSECYGLEYFCTENDGVWLMPDDELIALGKHEMEMIGLGRASDFVDGCVVRQPKAYPVYDDEYARNVETIRRELAERYPRLHLVGRNGMHKYNNQDHAMMTAMLTAENILAGRDVYDTWQVNQDAEYHEAGEAGEQSGGSGLRKVPSKVKS